MLHLSLANLSLPLLLVGAKLEDVRDFCQKQLCNCQRSTDLFVAGVHPDYIELNPDLEQVRSLIDFVSARPQLSTKKIVLIPNAEKLNDFAANALLKNLEEPISDTVFILLVPHEKLLLPTITSRCQVVRILVKKDDNMGILGHMSQDLLDLWALKSVKPLQIVEKWQSLYGNDVLYWMELTVANLLKSCYLGEQKPPTSLEKMWNMLDAIKQGNRWRLQNKQPNQQLLLESILLG